MNSSLIARWRGRLARCWAQAPNSAREALAWALPLLLFIKVRLNVLYQSVELGHGEEELFQGLLGRHLLLHGRLAPWIVYQHSQDAGGTLHTGLLSYIPFALVDQSYASLKLAPLGVGALILLVWMALVRRPWGRGAAFLFGTLLAVLPDYLLKRGLFAFGNHHDLNLLLGLMFLAFFGMYGTGLGRLRQVAWSGLFGLSLGYALYIDLSVLSFLPLFALMFWTAGLRRIRLLCWPALLVGWRIGFHPWYASHRSQDFLNYVATFASQGVPWGVQDNPSAAWTAASLARVLRFSTSEFVSALFLIWLFAACGLVLWANRDKLLHAIYALSPLPRHKLSDPLDWQALAFPAAVLGFAASFLVFTRGQAGHPDLIRYWTPLYACMVACQTQGLLVLIRSPRRALSRVGTVLAALLVLLMYRAIPENSFNQLTEEELTKPGYSYFYFTGNLLAHYEMPINQALFSDLNVGRAYPEQKLFLEGVAVAVGALTGYDVSGHLDAWRGLGERRRRVLFTGLGFGETLCAMKWSRPAGRLPELSGQEQDWARQGRKRFIEQLGRAKLIDRGRDRLKDAAVYNVAPAP